MCPSSKHDSEPEHEPGNEPDEYGIKPENWFWTSVSMLKTFEEYFALGEQLEKLDRPHRSYELDYLKTHRACKEDILNSIAKSIAENSEPPTKVIIAPDA